MTTMEMRQEALCRAHNGTSRINAMVVIAEFRARGIEDIRPRENVLTYQAWLAEGRQVRKGEHGVHVATFIPVNGKVETDPETGAEVQTSYRKMHSATVFHVSQTDPVNGHAVQS